MPGSLRSSTGARSAGPGLLGARRLAEDRRARWWADRPADDGRHVAGPAQRQLDAGAFAELGALEAAGDVEARGGLGRRGGVALLRAFAAGAGELEARRGAFAAPARFAQFTRGVLDDPLWKPAWEQDGFGVRFGEPWRRLLVRAAIAGTIVRSPSLINDPDLALRLRDVVALTSQSAHVARIVLEEELTLQTHRSDVPRGQARIGLEAMARSYDRLRAELRPGAERTAQLDAIVTQARHLARDGRLWTEELRDLLTADRPGDRVIGLAAAQATADPQVVDEVYAIAMHPRTPFEGYHALLALEALAQGMDRRQLESIAENLRYLSRAEELARDSARRHLIDRILTAFDQDRRGDAEPDGSLAGR